jgi:hypothetical protein
MVLAHSCACGDAGEQPTQLDRGGELATPLEGGPYRRSLSLGDGEHRWSMGRTLRRVELLPFVVGGALT